MAIFGKALTLLLKHLATCCPERDPKMVDFADDLIRRLSRLRSW